MASGMCGLGYESLLTKLEWSTEELARAKLEIERATLENLKLRKELAKLKGEAGRVKPMSVENSSEWKVVSSGKTKLVVKKYTKDMTTTTTTAKCTNPFSPLIDELDVSTVRGRDDKEGIKTLIVGDSQVRYMDRAFCGKNKNRMRVCLPGAGVGDIIDRMDNILSGNGNKPIICLSAGGNDIGRCRSEELLDKFKAAIDRIRTKGGIPIICGVLPRRRVGSEWLSRAVGVNDRLDRYCKSISVPFIDNWDNFYGRRDLYARDGVHLSRDGVATLAGALEGAVQKISKSLNC